MTGAGEGRAVDGVLFDVDDTLVDTHGAFATALAAVSRTWLPDLDPARDVEVLDHWRADAGGRYRQYTRGEVSYREQRMARANDLHAAFGGPVLDDDAYDTWNGLFEDRFTGAWAAHTDAAAVVRHLLDAGIRVGALTNAATAYQVAKLTRAGLADDVPLLVGVDTLGFGKPDPRVFAEACRRLGTEPGRTAYVGDELDVDARAAVAAGLRGVWLARPELGAKDANSGTPLATDTVITTLADLPGVLGVCSSD
ncbi:HAD family hydrolase [Cellulomonas triticagri]|uniref:HAD family hydrolase n=1 Tax=Cellulomonas triticagri TaxID=2483352 RepID=A0A3M2JKV5_9CELL|nr:HAD family hydrolase [Cellulomonas triticagri]RMI12791.1 HAD family hydrolase [Cellulomonas triticagri]